VAIAGAIAGAMAGRLLSVNVGGPRRIEREGKTVRAAIWKDPVEGPRMVRGINIDGDDQADRLAHGGEHRAVFVYQIDSYRYWERELERDDLTHLRTLPLNEHRPVIEICRSPGRRSAPGTASPAFVETRYFKSTATTTVGPEMANIAARVYPILGDVRGQPKARRVMTPWCLALEPSGDVGGHSDRDEQSGQINSELGDVARRWLGREPVRVFLV
jgi:hypothetical protein